MSIAFPSLPAEPVFDDSGDYESNPALIVAATYLAVLNDQLLALTTVVLGA